MTTEERRLAGDRSSLPADFVWGVATAAYQIEGGVTEGGRGPSIWDTFSHTPGKTLHGDTGDIACDHYHRWETDLDLMAELGIPAYRLSLSWSRLQPAGTGALNPEGVAFYRNLLRGAVDRGITPYVTLYHWDLPQPLQDAGGWPERATAYRFGEYAALVAGALGDLAEHWITINEPICASFLSYSWGMQAPGFTDTGLAVRAAHHLLLAHGLALRALRDHRPGARVGITNLIGNLTPATDSTTDIAAVRSWDAQSNRLFLDPVYLGRYSGAVIEALGAYGITADEVAGGLVQPGDLELISAPTDFAGVNHYTNMIVRADPTAANGISWEHVTPAPTSFGWSNTPEALTAVLLRVAEISGLPLYVTESGAKLSRLCDARWPGARPGTHQLSRRLYRCCGKGRRGRCRRPWLFRLVVPGQLRMGRGVFQTVRPGLRRLPDAGPDSEGQRTLVFRSHRRTCRPRHGRTIDSPRVGSGAVAARSDADSGRVTPELLTES